MTQNMTLDKLVLILSGLVWAGLTALANFSQPVPAGPQSPLDNLALVGTALAFFLLALSLGIIHRTRDLSPGLIKNIWLGGIGLAILAATLAGILYLAQNLLGLDSLGVVNSIVIYGLIAGLVVAGVVTLRPDDVPRLTGWLLITIAMGVAFPDRNGGYIVGFSLLLMWTTLPG